MLIVQSKDENEYYNFELNFYSTSKFTIELGLDYRIFVTELPSNFIYLWCQTEDKSN